MDLPDVFKISFDEPDLIRDWFIADTYVLSLIARERHAGDTRDLGFEAMISWRAHANHINQVMLSYAIDLGDDDFSCRRLVPDKLRFRPTPRTVVTQDELRLAWETCDVDNHLADAKLEIAQYLAVESLWHLKMHRFFACTTSKRVDMSRTEGRAERAISMLLHLYPDEEHPAPIPAPTPGSTMRY